MAVGRDAITGWVLDGGSLTLGSENVTYLMKATHKNGGEIFIGTVESLRLEDEFYKLPSSINTVIDSVTTLFNTFEDARPFGFLSPDLAIAVLGALPETKNLGYTIVEVKER